MARPTPYYADDTTTLYLGDMAEVLPKLGAFDCCVTDPPYVSTQLAWDKWPPDWPSLVAARTSSMWCFGTLRMFLDQREQFAGWSLSHDIVWEKHNGASFANDRFKGVHELIAHWYRGRWAEIHRDTPKTADATPRTVRRKQKPTHTGDIGPGTYVSEDGGPRLARSVQRVRSMHGRAIHPTEKPIGILAPLIEYACPPGGVVLDPFAGSGSTAAAARLLTGRRAVLIEADERYCEAIANRLAQDVLPIPVEVT